MIILYCELKFSIILELNYKKIDIYTSYARKVFIFKSTNVNSWSPNYLIVDRVV